MTKQLAAASRICADAEMHEHRLCIHAVAAMRLALERNDAC